MSVFGPSARTTDPAGREWEIYAYRLQLPRRGPPDPTPRIAYLLAWIPRLLLRFLVDLPAAGVRALRSDRWTIEAISWAPFRASYVWTTTREHRGQVLAPVEGGLARGETPRPRNAQLVRSQ